MENKPRREVVQYYLQRRQGKTPWFKMTYGLSPLVPRVGETVSLEGFHPATVTSVHYNFGTDKPDVEITCKE
jgi:hypothetical protein